MKLMNLKTLAAAACLSLAMTSNANAVTLTLDDLSTAGTDQTIVDLGTGSIDFAGAVGTFDSVTATGLGAPSLGGVNFAQIGLNLETGAGGIGTLQVTLTDTGLTIPTDPMTGVANAVSDLGISSLLDAIVTVETFIRVGGGTFEALSSLTGMSGDFDLFEGITGVLAPSVQFDLRTVITVEHTSVFSSTTADSSLTLSPGEFVAVPLPAALPLLLASLAGLGIVGRRRKIA